MTIICVDGLDYRIGCLIKGVLAGEVSAFAHQANCMSVFGAGIAPILANNFPELLIVDSNYDGFLYEKLGDLTHTDMTKIPIGFNLYGQLYPGRNTNYDALRASLRKMNTILRETGDHHVVGLPKLGCGIGGGDWCVVSRIIKEELTDVTPLVYFV